MKWPTFSPKSVSSSGPAPGGRVTVSLHGISKRFSDTLAVDDVSLTVCEGEFLSLLGPSGCGKTTTLRVVAGFEQPDQGRVLFGGDDVTEIPPYRRGIGMVFQSYALFPHMTVAENIAYGLRRRRVSREEISARTADILNLVHLPGLEQRYPRQLSGGQQQRVAIARALVIRPRVLLLDEPLSNLDAKLREGMRIELRQIQREVGITAIYVTHDQEEALALSDRIAVMDHGRIAQVGTPYQIYQAPEDPFVAQFIGRSNILRGVVERVDGSEVVLRSAGGLVVTGRTSGHLGVGDEAIAVVRHEQAKLTDPATAVPNLFEGRVQFVTYYGSSVLVLCAVGEE
ncbi:MAG: ABC transporter ATP-binding protein, partial [Chloroflexi bacterium]|nr:ABC transporter ATP-binding protein [Chloroflexota bacterium]